MNDDELRALDAAVAERVLGWRNVHRESVYGWHTHEDQPDWIGDDPVRRECRPVPRFSADIAAAWQVVEHLRAAGWRMTLSGQGVLYSVVFDHADREPVRGAMEPDAPLAICRAALAALAGEGQGAAGR